MPSKYQIISQLLASKSLEVTSSIQAYSAFLCTAAQNYKYSYQDQLLIHAQKPDATACADISLWNQLGRWVNRKTKGIALLPDNPNSNVLRYVFDVSDTNSRARRNVSIWQLEPWYEETVMRNIADSFGVTALSQPFPEFVLHLSNRIAEDNIPDYLPELRNSKAGSLLEDLDDMNLEVWLREALADSIAFEILQRCGYNGDAYVATFATVPYFNTRPTATLLGSAVSSLSEMVLREIGVAVKALAKEQNRHVRTFASSADFPYNEARNQSERSQDYGTDLHPAGGLSDSQPATPGAPEGGQVRDAAQQLSEKSPGVAVYPDADGGHPESPSGGDRPEGERDDGAADEPDGSGARRDGGTESTEPAAVGATDEQHPTLSGGDRLDGSHLQLSGRNGNYTWDVDFYPKDDEKNELIRTSDALKDHRVEIAAFFADHPDSKECGNFLRGYFDNYFVEKILSNGQRAGYRAYADTFHVWRGAYLSRTNEVYMRWSDVARNIQGMILLEKWLEPGEVLFPTEEQQKARIAAAEAERSGKFILPQGAIDYILTQGSQMSDRKFRIYEQFLGHKTPEENIAFLKNEYGWNGSSDAIPGSGYWKQHDTKGISISRFGYGAEPKDTFLLRWPAVEKRIQELIQADRYLTPAEKKEYGAYVHDQNLRSKRQVIADEFSSIVADYNDFQEQLGNPHAMLNNYVLSDCRSRFVMGEKTTITLSTDNFILPLMREAMQTIIQGNTHLTERCEAMLNELHGELATPMEPSYDEQNPPPEPQKEYRFSLGDTVYLGAQEYEILAIGPERVRLYDPLFPLFNQELSREEFNARISENPRNDHLLRVVEESTEAAQPESESSTEEPLPIGRIEYLHTNGQVAEEVEYTDIAKFQHDISRENYYGAPMQVTMYANAQGETVPYDFLYELDPPLHGITVIPNPHLEKEPDPELQAAMSLISNFCQQEYDSVPDFTDMRSIGIAYTTITDMEIPVQVNVNLIDFQLERYIEGILVDSRKYSSLAELTEAELTEPDFDSLVSFTEAELAKAGIHRTDDELVARWQSDGEQIEIWHYANGWFYNHYGIQNGQPDSVAGPFDTMEDARQALLSHRPQAIEAPAQESPETEPPMPPEPVTPKQAQSASHVLLPEYRDSQRANYRIETNLLGAGTPMERFQNNIQAIQLLHRLEAEQRLATPDEQETLASYVGWGGLPQFFEESNIHYEELKALLSPEEYAAARESTLTAFYTPPVVIRAMYHGLANLGFQTGNVLEPSCGVGNFMGLLPDAMAGSKLYGVELDSISGHIAQQLYQKNTIAVQGFEQTSLPDSFFDVAIGNVPFGQFKVSDKQYDRYNFLIHDYFFARTLDKVRPGGVIAFITSKGTMDKENPSVRKYIAQRAELLGAIRLPNNTFKAAAGTEVTSDILFLQKRNSLVDIEPDWVHLGTDPNGLKMNAYFVEHPEMILGTMELISGPHGLEPACVPIEGQSLEALLSAAIANIHGEITAYDLDELPTGADTSIPANPDVRNFSYTIVDGSVYFRENSRMNRVELSDTSKERLRQLLDLRDCVRTLIQYQLEDYPESMIRHEQIRLNEIYDRFNEKYGRINSRANRQLFSNDSSYYLLSSLEVLDEEGKFLRKADMFTKRTIKQKVAVSSVDTASEALALSLAEKASVDMPYMMELTHKTESQILSDLRGVVFLNPEWAENENAPQYLAADEYLSGNVRQKLALAQKYEAEDPDRYAANVEALKAVQPQDLSASEISVRLGATWLPADVVSRFMFELFDTPWYCQRNIKVHFSQYTGEWNVEGKSEDKGNIRANSTYGTTRINGYRIIEETLNLRDVRIFDYVEDEKGKRTAVLNKTETAIAQGKQELIKQAFSDWIWTDPDRRNRLTKIYNERFNSTRPREYDGSHLNFVGINPEITLRPHQVNAIAHILYGGNTLLAHVVGAGKTFEMVAAAQESKRLGLCQKSMFVVPNHLTEQWASEYLQLYPSANILVATKKDFEAKNRKRFCSRIVTGDYDAIIIGHSQFEKIPISLERQKALLNQQIQEVIDGISELKRNHGDSFSIKQLERTKKSIKQKLEKLNDQTRKDDVVTFEELGVDRIFVDEAHGFKNLAAFTKMRNVGGISQTEAMKSSDLYMKCRYLDELTGSRGVIFATGTPISNSMVELYTMQKYLQYETLERNHLLHFDAWASTFGETVTAIELSPEGTGYRAKTRFAKFYNLPELMAMFKEVADIQTADMLKLPVPEVEYHNVVLKPSEQQRQMVAGLSARAERVRNKMVRSDEDNMLLITNDGRKLALDQRLVNPLLPDSYTGKVSQCAQNVYDIWERTADQKSAQMIFCDLSTPGKTIDMEMQDGVAVMSGFQNVYDDLKKKLIAKGIPETEIAYIHSANTEAAKKELFSKVRSGQIRVLIGSTQKMGAGTNVQRKLIALHHVDCPWRPSDLQQREGRIVRQGNENTKVDIFTYVTEDTFDSYLFQMVERKQSFIGQIMTSKSPARSAEDIDEIALNYAEIKALCAGNPLIKEKMDLDIEVQRLKLLKSSHLGQRYALEDKIAKDFPKRIALHQQLLSGYDADIQLVQSNTSPDPDAFGPMDVQGKLYTQKKAAGEAILAACHAMTSADPVLLGKYRGFTMTLFFDAITKEYKVTLQAALSHTTALGTDVFGNIQRLDNLLDSFPLKKNACTKQLRELHTQMENAKQEAQKPFPKEDELKEKSARLDELNILLNMDKSENEIVDGEPGNAELPQKNSREHER